MDHEAILSFEYETSDQAERVERAIDPEIGDIDDERSRVRCQRDGSRLELVVEARDLIALRAAVNTYCSLVTVAERAGRRHSETG